LGTSRLDGATGYDELYIEEHNLSIGNKVLKIKEIAPGEVHLLETSVTMASRKLHSKSESLRVSEIQ